MHEFWNTERPSLNNKNVFKSDRERRRCMKKSFAIFFKRTKWNNDKGQRNDDCITDSFDKIPVAIWKHNLTDYIFFYGSSGRTLVISVKERYFVGFIPSLNFKMI